MVFADLTCKYWLLVCQIILAGRPFIFIAYDEVNPNLHSFFISSLAF